MAPNCNDCDTEMVSIEMDSEHANWMCPECAPEFVKDCLLPDREPSQPKSPIV